MSSNKKELILSTIVSALLNILTLGLFGTIIMIIVCVKNCKPEERAEEFMTFSERIFRK